MRAAPTPRPGQLDMPHRRDSAWPPVLGGGLLAGALDITYACLFWAIKADLPPTAVPVGGRRPPRRGKLRGRCRYRRPRPIPPLLHRLLHGADLLSRGPSLAGPLAPPRPARHRLRTGALRRHELRRRSALGRERRLADPTWIALTVAVHAFLIGCRSPCSPAGRPCTRAPPRVTLNEVKGTIPSHGPLRFAQGDIPPLSQHPSNHPPPRGV